MESDLVGAADNTIHRMAGDERRQQLLEVAMHLFSKHGFSGTTTKRIAEEAGVSEAMVFKHFENKDQLYTDIIDHKACSLGMESPMSVLSDFVEAKNDFGVFYHLALNALNHHRQDTEFIRLLLHSALEGHAMARTFFDSYVTTIYESIGEYIEERQKDGAFREVNPKIVVRAFSGMFIHHSMTNIIWDKDQKLLKVSNERAAKEFATVLLDGIRKKDSSSDEQNSTQVQS
ncbi:MAG: TetR/AcrR family transcriptional regulator [Pyrinomonadaceae bacterium]|nr:TetR/AcrR family transcriptional regulator [Pyrinomonadaceae bacterium]